MYKIADVSNGKDAKVLLFRKGTIILAIIMNVRPNHPAVNLRISWTVSGIPEQEKRLQSKGFIMAKQDTDGYRKILHI